MAYIFDPSKGETPESIKRKRAIAEALMRSGVPVARNVGEGLAVLGDAIGARMADYRANKAEAYGREQSAALWPAISEMFGGGGASATAPSAPSPTGGGDPYADAIASIESRGSGDYGAIGPTHPKLGRALGRYQVMEANIGPWSRDALGREVTADEFMADPTLQDAIFRHQFGKYVQQYGPEGAAQAWFGGPGGVGKTERRDALGTSIGEYGQKFRRALAASGGAPVQVASLDPTAGMTQAAPAPASREAAMAALARPQRVAQAGPAAAPQPHTPARNAVFGKLLEIAQNPWLNETQRGIVGALLKQEMERNAPMSPLEQAQLRKLQVETGLLENPRMTPAEEGRLGLDREKFAYERGKPATNDLAEYDRYAEQERAAGREPVGFLDYQRALKEAGRASTNVTVGSERGYDKTLGEGYGKRFLDMQEGAQTAQRTLDTMAAMEQMLTDPGMYSGIGANQVMSLKRAASALGMDAEGVTSMETFNALAKQAALDNMGGSLGTGFSNADRDFVVDQVAGLQNTPQGNRRLIEITSKIQQRRIELAQIARDYAARHDGRIDAGFDDYARQWAERNPLFPRPASPASPANEPAPAGVDPGVWQYMTPEERALWRN